MAALALILMATRSADAAVEFTPCKNHFSPEQQIQLGDKAKAQVYKQTPLLPDSSPMTEYISRLGQRLVAVAPGYKWPYNFHVANVAAINAFALPGGSVFVNLGTIQAAESEAQLAGVMAHEISHVVLQHSVCNAERQQKVGLLAGLGEVAAGVLLGGAIGGVASEGIGLTAGLGFLKMSRAAERQADLEGARIAYNSGFDPRGMSEFFQTIENRYGAGGSQFTSDHPNPGNRTEYVNKEIATFPPHPDLIKDSPEFERIKDQALTMHAYTAKEIASGIWKTQNPPQMAGIPLGSGGSVASIAQDLNSGPTKVFRGPEFSIEVPGNWSIYEDRVSALIGPGDGIIHSSSGAATGVTHGLLTNVYRAPLGVNGAAAVDALIGALGRDNPGFAPSPREPITVSGAAGQSIDCDNPSANRGHGEHDWIVVFPQADGSLRYFVFVAPTPEFESLRPGFRRILQSLRIAD